MNIFIDLIHDSITITKTFSKKMIPFKVEKSFEYPLIVSNNVEKALTDILDNEVISALKSEKSNLKNQNHSIRFHLISKNFLSLVKAN